MISMTSRHAIKALIGLARAEGEGAVLGRDLADSADVPRNYLAKILQALRKAGIVEATRGPGGGYRLLRAPVDVALLEIVELFDGNEAHPHCFLSEGHECSDETACAAHAAWREVHFAYVRFLEQTTLADLDRTPAGPLLLQTAGD